MKNKFEVSLTRLLRRRLDMNHIEYILDNFNVPSFVGCLPPLLCACVAPNVRGVTTYKFHGIITDFLSKNLPYLTTQKSDIVVDIDAARQLFGTDCKLIARGINVCGFSPWSGLTAVVFKLSFPKIGAEYALKSYYKTDNVYRGHGALFEISTAFAANHAEPKDNSPIYMASLSGDMYMLSKWQGDIPDNRIRDNKNQIFMTCSREMRPRNYRHGRRIDFGDTHLTSYGTLSYRGRKMFRIIMDAALHGNTEQIDYLYTINKREYQRRMLDNVIDLAVWTCAFDNKYDMANLIENCINRQR